MTLTIKKQEDREAVATILFRNGYTVRQKKYKPAGAKKAETILEVMSGHDGSTASVSVNKMVTAAADQGKISRTQTIAPYPERRQA